MKYEKREPDKPVRTHYFKFFEKEIIEALKDYALKTGKPIPKGEIYLSGLDNRSGDFEERDILGLRIEEKISINQAILKIKNA